MRRNIGIAFGVSALVMLSGLAAGQTGTPQTPPTHPAAVPAGEPALAALKTGKLTFGKDTTDLGSIVQNEVKEIHYKFKNDSTLPVVVKELKRSCGCTSALIKLDGSDKTTEPKEADANTWCTVPGGATGEIVANFDPKGKVGHQSKTVTVISDDAEREQIVLTFTVQVEQNIMVEPSVINLGTLDRGASKTLKVTVVGRTPDFAATAATVTMSELFDIKVGETREVERGGKKLRATELEITFKATGKSGRANDQLNIRTNDPAEPMRQVGVTFNILGELACEPTVLAMSPAAPGAEMTGQVTLKHRKGKAFKVLKVEAAGPAAGAAAASDAKFTFAPTDAANSTEWKIGVALTAPVDRPNVNLVLKVTTDVEGEEMVQVRAYGMVRKAQAAK